MFPLKMDYKSAKICFCLKTKTEKCKNIGRWTHLDLPSSIRLGEGLSGTGKYTGVRIISGKSTADYKINILLPYDA
jgi:hypothetical protein